MLKPNTAHKAADNKGHTTRDEHNAKTINTKYYDQYKVKRIIH
jgi:hypothetical protein